MVHIGKAVRVYAEAFVCFQENLRVGRVLYTAVLQQLCNKRVQSLVVQGLFSFG
jgi:hypothetical protein